MFVILLPAGLYTTQMFNLLELFNVALGVLECHLTI